MKRSFAFTEKIVEQDSTRSLNQFLFTNISLEETIVICTNTPLRNTERVEGLSKIEFKELYLLLQSILF